MATISDCTTTSPESDDTHPYALLPFPVLRSGHLAVERLPGEGGTLYRSGNIAVRATRGTIQGVSIHRVWLTAGDTRSLWRVLCAAGREGAGIFPGERPHGFIVPPPARRISAGPIWDDGAPDPGEQPALLGTRYSSGRCSLAVRHGPIRRGWLNAFGATGLDAAAVLRDLPDALALLVEL
ncbi:MAG TPA: hypothetical protein VFS21_00215 [Roseiflexaceae bacterium]|nr:hypothetical protein [Roseiflexaceae bacterium]